MDNPINPEWVDNYLTTPYLDGGRDPDVGVDCWGSVRYVLHKFFEVPLLKAFGSIQAEDKASMTKAYREIKKTFTPCEPKPGAIAAGFNGVLLIHVGVVIEENGLKVLHTGAKLGMSKSKIRDFNRLFLKVKYYEYNQ